MEDYVYLPTSTALEKLGSEATLIKGQVPSLFLPRLDPNAPVWEMLRAEARYIDELSSE
jgi:hypothetical protein